MLHSNIFKAAWLPGANWMYAHLLDHDPAANFLSWQWVAGTGVDASPYFRIFNPTSQIQKFDKELKYIQKWDPDIICMQEYNTKELINDIANHATYFDEKYPYSFFSKDHQIYEANYFAGNIIYSKYKILYAERVPFTNQESLIYVDLLKGDDTIAAVAKVMKDDEPIEEVPNTETDDGTIIE